MSEPLPHQGDSKVRPWEISPEDLASMMSGKQAYAILDVRETWELDICKLDGCIHIPLNDLVEKKNGLPDDRPIVVVCHLGQRSLLATQHLRAAGFDHAVNLRGGVDAWADHVDPEMRRY